MHRVTICALALWGTMALEKTPLAAADSLVRVGLPTKSSMFARLVFLTSKKLEHPAT